VYGPDLPGCASQGDTHEAAVANISRGDRKLFGSAGEIGAGDSGAPDLDRDGAGRSRVSGLPQVNGDRLLRALSRAGFDEVHRKGSHVTVAHREDPTRIGVDSGSQGPRRQAGNAAVDPEGRSADGGGAESVSLESAHAGAVTSAAGSQKGTRGVRPWPQTRYPFANGLGDRLERKRELLRRG
jgi:predicted RNA binding protein YcfA (HicA-like mRNA interferase family)